MPTPSEIQQHDFTITRSMCESRLHQKARVIWMFGLSGSGKSTLADALSKSLFSKGHYSTILDGDNTRLGLNCDLGFSSEERDENLRRVAEVSKLMLQAGLIVICSFISPLQKQRDMISRIIGEDDLVFIHVDCSLKVCEARDVKGLYKRARAGEIKNFTGISSEFELPTNNHISVNTSNSNLEECNQKVLAAILPIITR